MSNNITKEKYMKRSVSLDNDEITYVITRTNRKVPLDPNRITQRLKKLIRREPRITRVNPFELMIVVTQSIKSGITTYEIDEYAADTAASLSLTNPHYMKLAGRIVVDNHQKATLRSFADKMALAYMRKDTSGSVTPLVSKEFIRYVEQHCDQLESMMDYRRDFLFDFFGFRTFQRMYGIKINGSVIERPQDMYMRTAIALHMNTKDKREHGLELEMTNIKSTYDLLSFKKYTQASPTYFNAGSNHTQYASCFLLGTNDSLEGIMSTGVDAAAISKWGGGIGIHVNSWRSTGAMIRGTNGKSSGIVPFLRIYNNIMRAFNQGGKRMGSAAIYLMPHHPDIMSFLRLKLPGGEETTRASDLFYAVWIPDLFMERVRSGSAWSLFDSDKTVDLSEYTGSEYTKKYLELEAAGLYSSQIDARTVWEAIYKANEQKGVPYILFADHVNKMSNQKNIGVIKSSNLCAEITEFSNDEEHAVCNLASCSLSACVFDMYSPEELKLKQEDLRVLDHEFPINPYFDFKELINLISTMAINLDNIINKNFYPTVKTFRSNMLHRPIGIGLQGMADTYHKMRYAFDSEQAGVLNKQILETMYYAALSQSTKTCRELYLEHYARCDRDGHTVVTEYLKDYTVTEQTYNNCADIPKHIGAHPSMTWNGGSPLYNGVFHWELYELDPSKLSGMYDWETLRAHIKIYGTRNSLHIALMPTASTSQLLGNNECFEPFTSNIYKRKTLAGEFIVINKYLIHDLYRLGLWNKNMKEYILALEGSIQAISGIPDEIKLLYKTAWEINPILLIDRAADRQPFVDQSQSLNLYVEDINISLFNKMMFHAWNRKLKTGKYYLHTRPASMPQKFTIDPEKQVEMEVMLEAERVSRASAAKFLEPMQDDCIVCGA